MLRPTWAYKLVPLKWHVSRARGTGPKSQGGCQQYITPQPQTFRFAPLAPSPLGLSRRAK